MTGAFDSISPLQQMISSSAGVLISSTFMVPLDVVKIRLQAQKTCTTQSPHPIFNYYPYSNPIRIPAQRTQYSVAGDSCLMNGPASSWSSSSIPRAVHSGPGYYNGMFDALIKISRIEGIRTLWSGLHPTLVMAVPATCVYFTCYEKCRHYLGYSGKMEKGDWWKPMAAGGTARAISVTVISPVEMIRTKMQSQKLGYSQIVMAVKRTYREAGIRGLYKGWAPTIWRDVPFSALFWLNCETMKSYLSGVTEDGELQLIHNVIAGAYAGMVAGILTLPFDVIKTHRQIKFGETGAYQVTSTLTLLLKLFKAKGTKALFTGLVPRIAKVAPQCAIIFSVYDFCKNYFKDKNRTRELENNVTIKDCMDAS